MNFYPKFGYSLSHDLRYSFYINNPNSSNHNDCREINVNDKNDLNVLLNIISSRLPRSTRFDCINSSSIFLWYCFNVFKDMVYILDGINVIVVFEENGNVIELYDVVAQQPVIFGDILHRITGAGNKKNIFHFTPNFADISNEELTASKNEDMFMMRLGKITRTAIRSSCYGPCIINLHIGLQKVSVAWCTNKKGVR